MAGVPVGRELADDDPMADRLVARAPGAGSVIAIVATDAPLLPGQCKALARRVPLGLARTGTTGSHFSGDIFLAFSTANRGELALGLDQRRAGGRRVRLAALRAMDAHGSVLRSRRAGHRGGGAECALRRRGDGRRERAPLARPATRARAPSCWRRAGVAG